MIKKKIFIIILILFNFFILSVILLYLSNFILSFYYDDNVKLKRYISKNNIEYDNRSYKEIYNDLKKLGKDPVIIFYPAYNQKYNLSKLNEIATLSGVSKRLTIFCREQNKYSLYESDRYGFNNPDKVWDEKNLEYLFIGDSFVHGSCVEQDNNVVSKFSKLTKKNSLNLGMGGNGPLIELATLIEYGIKFKPKKVFWFYYEGNDLQSDLVREVKDPKLLKYLKKNHSNNLIYKQKLIDEINNNFLKKNFYEKEININHNKSIKINKYLKLNNLKLFLKDNFTYFEKRKYKNFKKENYKNLQAKIYNINQTSLKNFKKIILNANDLIKKNNGEFYFVYVPEYWRYRYKSFQDQDIQKYYQSKNLIINLIKDNNINLIDLDTELFRKEKKPLEYYPFGLYGHFNESGYELIAKFIKEKIK